MTDLVCTGPQFLLHPSRAHQAGCPLCNPTKTVPELNATAGVALPSKDAALDPSLLMDNAACASQCSELLDDHPTRQAVLLNVYRPLWDEIVRLSRECTRMQAFIDQDVMRQVIQSPAPETGCDARPLSEWHEDDGPAVWWKFPVEEAAWIGGPNDSDWPGYHTHWTPHPPVPTLKAAEPSVCKQCGGDYGSHTKDCALNGGVGS